MKKYFFVVLICFLNLSLFAQNFEIPENIKLETKEDYKKYEQDILNAINWTKKVSLSEQKMKRKKVNAFLFKWMSGTPSVSIEISQGLTPFMDCSECLMSFMNGWTKYSLENNYSKDKTENALAAIKYTINFYEKNKKELGKISTIEKFIKKKNKGQLKTYIESKL